MMEDIRNDISVSEGEETTGDEVHTGEDTGAEVPAEPAPEATPEAPQDFVLSNVRSSFEECESCSA